MRALRLKILNSKLFHIVYKENILEKTKEIKHQIDLLEKSNQITPEFIEFYRQILLIQHKYKKLIDKSKLSVLASTVDIEQRLSEGRPLIDATNFYVDKQFAESMVQEVVDFLKQSRAQNEIDEILKIGSVSEDKNFDLTTILKNFVFEDKDYFVKLTKNLDVKLELLIFIARTMDLPLLEAHREVLRPNAQVIQANWLRPFCPTCGSVATMGRLEKELGQKYLWCSVCNTQWNFQRIQCPFCLNIDQTKLRYFFVEEDSPYRVDVCDNCKRYIKTVDERKFAEERDVFMNVEDLLTVSLDELAKKDGYQSALWWLEVEKA